MSSGTVGSAKDKALLADKAVDQSCSGLVYFIISALALAIIIVSAKAISDATTYTPAQFGTIVTVLGGCTALMYLAHYQLKKRVQKAEVAEKKMTPVDSEKHTMIIQSTYTAAALTFLAIAIINILGSQGIGFSSAADMAKWTLITQLGFGALAVAMGCSVGVSRAARVK